MQAGSAAAIPTLGVETTSLLALLLSFWVVGGHDDRGQAMAGAAIGCASIVVVAQLDRRVGPSDAVVGIVIGGVIWLIAYALETRARSAPTSSRKGLPGSSASRRSSYAPASPPSGGGSHATSTT